MDYALRVNQKKRAEASSPDRNEQFLFIQDMRERFHRLGHPIISVDLGGHPNPVIEGHFKTGQR